MTKIAFLFLCLILSQISCLTGNSTANKEQAGNSVNRIEGRKEFNETVPSHNKPSSISVLNESRVMNQSNHLINETTVPKQPNTIQVAPQKKVQNQTQDSSSLANISQQSNSHTTKTDPSTDSVAPKQLTAATIKPQNSIILQKADTQKITSSKDKDQVTVSLLKAVQDKNETKDNSKIQEHKQDPALSPQTRQKRIDQLQFSKNEKTSKHQQSKNDNRIQKKVILKVEKKVEIVVERNEREHGDSIVIEKTDVVKNHSSPSLQPKQTKEDINKANSKPIIKQQWIKSSLNTIKNNIQAHKTQKLQVQKLKDEEVDKQKTVVKVPQKVMLVKVPQKEIPVKVPQKEMTVKIPQKEMTVKVPQKEITVNVPQKEITVKLPQKVMVLKQQQKLNTTEKSGPQIKIISLQQEENSDQSDAEQNQQKNNLLQDKDNDKAKSSKPISSVTIQKQQDLKPISVVNDNKVEESKQRLDKVQKKQDDNNQAIKVQEIIKQVIADKNKGESKDNAQTKSNLVDKRGTQQNKQIQQLQKVVSQGQNKEAIGENNPQYKSLTKQPSAEASNDLKKEQSNQQSQSKEQILQLLKNVKGSFNENLKNEIIKHLEKDIQQKQHLDSPLDSTITRQANLNHQAPLQLATKVQQEALLNDSNMDKTTVIVILILTFIISIPIVKEIRMKSNSSNNSKFQNQREQGSLGQTTRQKSGQFYRQQRDIMSETELGICQSEEI